MSYYFFQEKTRAFLFQQAGFEVADPQVINLGLLMARAGWQFGGSHTQWDCVSAGEKRYGSD